MHPYNASAGNKVNVTGEKEMKQRTKAQLRRHKNFVSYLTHLEACSYATTWVKSGKHDIVSAWTNCPQHNWQDWLIGEMTEYGTAAERACFASYSQIVRNAVLIVEEAINKTPFLKEKQYKYLKPFIRNVLKLLKSVMQGRTPFKAFSKKYKELCQAMEKAATKEHGSNYIFSDDPHVSCVGLIDQLYDFVYDFAETRKQNKGKIPSGYAIDDLKFDVEELIETIEALLNEDLTLKLFKKIITLNVPACNKFFDKKR